MLAAGRLCLNRPTHTHTHTHTHRRHLLRQSLLPGPGAYDVVAGGTGLALPQPGDPASVLPPARPPMTPAVLLRGHSTLGPRPATSSTVSRPMTTGTAGRARAAAAATAFPLLHAQAAQSPPAHHPGGAVALALTEPRFREPTPVSPPPTAYNPRPAADGATRRTFNVALASNEARSILFRQQL